VSVKQIIDTCLKGWELGGGALSLSVTADSFCYDDPNTGASRQMSLLNLSKISSAPR